jgi:hypothetical protein
MPERTFAQQMARRAKARTEYSRHLHQTRKRAAARRPFFLFRLMVSREANPQGSTAEAGCRSEHSRSKWPEGRRPGLA